MATRRQTKEWQCQECGKRLTLTQADRAMYGGLEGCPKCGGVDIDLADEPAAAAPATEDVLRPVLE